MGYIPWGGKGSNATEYRSTWLFMLHMPAFSAASVASDSRQPSRLLDTCARANRRLATIVLSLFH